MLSAHEPYETSYSPTAFGPPEPPRWPRLVARIVGTIGFAVVAPFALLMALGSLLTLVDGSGTENPSLMEFLIIMFTAVTSGVLALGLLIAWWREGLGALLILTGSGLLIVGTFGLAFLFVFPAPIVGIFYLLSWALHRTGDTGTGSLDRFSRWIRYTYYGRKYEAF